MHQVAQRYRGVWKRRLIQHRSGHSDSETAVYWLQTPRLFADLRIPSSPLPGLALEALSHAQHLALCEQKGFAGVTQIDADICQWHRKMDYQPDSGAEDIGRMHFETSECLIETALDDSYYEIWDRLPDSLGACRGQWLQAMDDPSRQGCLLLAGDYFLFAASRPTPLTPGTHLREHFSQPDSSKTLLPCLPANCLLAGITPDKPHGKSSARRSLPTRANACCHHRWTRLPRVFSLTNQSYLHSAHSSQLAVGAVRLIRDTQRARAIA